MGKVIIDGTGGTGGGSDECTALKDDVLKGMRAITADSDDEVVEGTLELTGDAADSQVLFGKTYYNTNHQNKRTGSMVNQGAVSQTLNAGGSYTIPAGYHNGSGKVMANNLTSQTPGSASAGHILSGYTAWVNGSKLTGSIASMGGQTITPGTSQQTVSSSGKYMTGNVVVNGISNLTAANIKKGVNVGGVVGTFEGYVPTANDLYLRGKSNISSWVYIQSEDFHFETGMIYAYNAGSGTPAIGASINLTGYNYLNAEVMCTSSNYIGLRINESDLFSSSITSTSLTLNANTVTTISLNISAISATRVFGLGIANNRHYYIYRIWLS
ncbi:MAG: hypothetical protein E7251_07205 [Paenibacillaceae bacterium]|nr:hypothetical protein [Paenibacillaceae bacterium]